MTTPSLVERIESAIGNQDWPAARALFAKYQASSWRTGRRLMLFGAALMDWTAVLDAEKLYLDEAGLPGPEALPAGLARAAIQARRQLHLLDDSLTVVRGQRRAAPAQGEWVRREADLLAQMGDAAGALRVASEAMKAGLPFAPLLGAAVLLDIGDLDECDSVLARAEGQGPSPELALLRARYWAAREDFAKALAIHEQLARGRWYADGYIAVAEHAALARRRDRLDALLGEVVDWMTEPAKGLLLRQAAPAILEAHYQLAVDWPALRPIAESLASAPLTPKAARPLGKLFLQAGDYPLAHRLARGMVETFPSSPAIWRQHLHVLSFLGDPGRLAAARGEMRRRLPRETYLASMSVAEARSWDESEVAELLAFNLAGRDAARRNRFFATLGEVRLSAEQVAALREISAGAVSPMIRERIDLKLLPARDLALLEEAVRRPVVFGAFSRTALEAMAAMRRTDAEIAAGQWRELTPGFGMLESFRQTERIVQARRETLLFPRESYAQSAELVARLIDRIGRCEPTSLVRLGDGEGHFLPGPNEDSPAREADRAVMFNIWWGSVTIDPAVFATIESDYRAAVDACDILAIIPPWRLVAEMSQRKFTTVHRGIAGGIHYCDVMANKSALVTSMHFPNDLHNWNLWVEFFAAVPRVSYISCHDMAPWLWRRFGVATRAAIRIPGEKQFVGLFDEAAAGGGETLFERHGKVCEAIDAEPGEVWLVAAGFLGKIYCDLIRRRGGVAIDIGSLADYWMGFNTRRYRLDAHTDIDLANTLFTDHVLAPPRNLERMDGPPEVCASTEDCRYNIAPPRAALARAPAAGRRRRLLAIGHPRCGAAHIAAAFRAQGWRVGHEQLLEDGIASWSHAADDRHVPYGDNAGDAAFDKIILFTRDPAAAIASIMVENGRGPSFAFRRLHIHRAFAVDLMDFTTALERAVASLVYWCELAMRRPIDAVIKVEEAEAAVAEWARRQSPAAPAADLDRALPAAPAYSGGEPGGDPSWDGRFGGKPVLTGEDYDRLGPDLRSRLEALCDRLGYAPPWSVAI